MESNCGSRGEWEVDAEDQAVLVPSPMWRQTNQGSGVAEALPNLHLSPPHVFPDTLQLALRLPACLSLQPWLGVRKP